jgi:hypothetical protein
MKGDYLHKTKKMTVKEFREARDRLPASRHTFEDNVPSSEPHSDDRRPVGRGSRSNSIGRRED